MSTNNDSFIIAEIQSRISYWREAADGVFTEVEIAKARDPVYLDCIVPIEPILADAAARATSKATNAGEPAGKRERA